MSRWHWQRRAMAAAVAGLVGVGGGQTKPPGRMLPIFVLTVDRCWAFQIEINPLDGRYRLGLSLPGR